METPDYGYLNYMFTVKWLVVFTVGLAVLILDVCSFDFDSNALFIAVMWFTISSYTSSTVAVVWVSIVERKMF
jgi:hypothetical protein